MARLSDWMGDMAGRPPLGSATDPDPDPDSVILDLDRESDRQSPESNDCSLDHTLHPSKKYDQNQSITY